MENKLKIISYNEDTESRFISEAISNHRDEID